MESDKTEPPIKCLRCSATMDSLDMLIVHMRLCRLFEEETNVAGNPQEEAEQWF